MGRATNNLTLEQQELLDSGLRMLAHMIAETHLRRTALKNHPQLPGKMPEEFSNEDHPGSYHE